MTENKNVKLSVLNLVPKFQNDTDIDAINRATELIKIVEKLGYHRYWVAEHHNFRGVLSSATALIIQHLLANSEKIRVGAGGVMLPNHTSLQVAETYGTLETLYPGRVDLGIGRAPGTDSDTAALIYRTQYVRTSKFVEAIKDIQRFMGSEEEQGIVSAYPGINTNVPIFMLGSSIHSASVSGELGLPYSFAGHFSPDAAEEAIKIYRKSFVPSKYLEKPYVILGVLAHGANSDKEAERLYTATQQAMLNMSRGKKGLYPLPDENFSDKLTSAEKIFLQSKMGINLMGTKETIKRKWDEIKSKYQPDEIMAVSYMSEIGQLETSYRILAEALKSQ